MHEEPTPENPTDAAAGNWRYQDRDFFKGGPKAKFANNLAALRTRAAVVHENSRQAVRESQTNENSDPNSSCALAIALAACEGAVVEATRLYRDALAKLPAPEYPADRITVVTRHAASAITDDESDQSGDPDDTDDPEVDEVDEVDEPTRNHADAVDDWHVVECHQTGAPPWVVSFQ